VATRALTARSNVPTGLSVSTQAVLPYVLGFLAAAGVTELLLLRTLSRVAVHIPKEGAVLLAYQVLTGVGSFAFNLATILAVAAVALYLLPQRERRLGAWRLLAMGPLALLLTWSVVLPLLRAADGSASSGTTDAAAKLAFGVAFALAVVGLAVPYALRRGAPLSRRAAVSLLAAAYLCAEYYALSYAAQGLRGAGGAPPLAFQILTAGEVLVVAGAGALFIAWGVGGGAVGAAGRSPAGDSRPPPKGGGMDWAFHAPAFTLGSRPNRLRLAVPTALSLLLLAGYLANGSTSAILSLWTEGLTLYLPFPLYLAAFWLYGWTVVACFQRRDGFAVGCALLLLFVGGYVLELTYQHLLAALALLVLTQAEATADEPDASPIYWTSTRT